MEKITDRLACQGGASRGSDYRSLSLAEISRLVSRLDGSIGAKSKAGKGTVFNVKLPVFKVFTG